MPHLPKYLTEQGSPDKTRTDYANDDLYHDGSSRNLLTWCESKASRYCHHAYAHQNREGEGRKIPTEEAVNNLRGGEFKDPRPGPDLKFTG